MIMLLWTFSHLLISGKLEPISSSNSSDYLTPLPTYARLAIMLDQVLQKTAERGKDCA